MGMKESFRRLCVASVWIVYVLMHVTGLFVSKSFIEAYIKKSLWDGSVLFIIATFVAGALHLTVNWIFQHKSSD